MARRRMVERGPVDTEGVPAELRDHASSAWSDPKKFREWVRANLPAGTIALDGRQIQSLCEPNEWSAGVNDRFKFAADAWAMANGIVQERSPQRPDWVRLNELGIQRFSALERARYRHLVIKEGIR